MAETENTVAKVTAIFHDTRTLLQPSGAAYVGAPPLTDCQAKIERLKDVARQHQYKMHQALSESDAYTEIRHAVNRRVQEWPIIRVNPSEYEECPDSSDVHRLYAATVVDLDDLQHTTLAATRSPIIELRLESLPDKGVEITLRPVSGHGKKAAFTDSDLRLYRGYYSVEARREGYKTFRGDIDLVFQHVETLTCNMTSTESRRETSTCRTQ